MTNQITDKVPCDAHSKLNGGTLAEYQSWCAACRAANAAAEASRTADAIAEMEALPPLAEFMAPSKIDPEVRKALANADLTVVAETDDYFIYSDGTLTPGPFGTRYSLMAATFDGARIHLAQADLSSGSAGGDWRVNVGPTSNTDDPIVLRAKADTLSRMADILAKALAS